MSTLQFVEMQKIVQNKTKQNKTKKKSNLWPKMSYLGNLGCKFEKILSYLKSASSNLSKCKVLCTDLKISPYIQIHTKIVPESFAFLIVRFLELFTCNFCIFLKK